MRVEVDKSAAVHVHESALSGVDDLLALGVIARFELLCLTAQIIHQPTFEILKIHPTFPI